MKDIPDSIFHSRLIMCKNPYGAVPAGKPVVFATYPSRRRGVNYVTLWIEEDGCEPVSCPMRWHGHKDTRDQYSVSFVPPHPGLYWYYFTIECPDGPRYVSKGYGGRCEIIDSPGDKYQLTVFDPAYHPPRWFGEGITYHIFPDRFRRERPPVQPEGEGIAHRELHGEWEGLPVYLPDKNGKVLNNDFFGGTIRGVIQSLDYLESLHVTTIYFNPIFQAYSNHRYDTGDYKLIDPMLGTEEDFRELCAKAARRGMRVLLDGVFNHTGNDSRYFNSFGRYNSVGAHQSQDSPYISWYDFHAWPDDYGSWWGIRTLPQVNELDPGYMDYIVENEDSVVRRWLRLGASGWRLDVADELPDEFIKRLNAAAKKEKPDAMIVGEVWEDASNKISYSERRKYLQGGELDSVMNYPLRNAILGFLNGGTAEYFAETIECVRENYPREVFYNLMNIIGTHDTPRALTVLGVSDEEHRLSREGKAKYTLPKERLVNAKKRLKLAAVIQFTMPGSPTVYYGDEVGMQGFEDPLNRCPFPWGHEDREMLEFYRRLCYVRASSSTLANGELTFIKCEGALLYYERSSHESSIAVIVNRGHHSIETGINADYALNLMTNKELKRGDDAELMVDMPPETACILRLMRN